MTSSLPDALRARYKDERHVARAPFLLNDLVDDAQGLEHLSALPVPQDGVFIGIPGFRSLDVLANAGSMCGDAYQHAVMVDCNHTQIKAMHNILKMIEESETPQAFIERFVPSYINWIDHVPRSRDPKDPSQPHPRQSEEDRQYFAARGVSNLSRDAEQVTRDCEDMMYNPQSWLFPGNYAQIRRMVQNNQIDTAVIHFNDPERMGTLKSWLDENKLHVSDMYLSSALGAMNPARYFDYYTTPHQSGQNPIEPMLSLIDKTTRVVVSEPRRAGRQNFKLSLYDYRDIDGLRQMHDEAKAHPENIGKDYGYIFAVGEQPLLLSSEMVGNQRFHTVGLENGQLARDGKKLEALNEAVRKLGFQVFPSVTIPGATMLGVPHSDAFIIPETMLEDPALYRGIRDTLSRELASAFQPPQPPAQRMA